jgi:hypothetical protein
MKIKPLIGVLAGVAMLGVGVAAIGAPTLVGTQSDPLAIDNLVIGATTYDVTFSTTAFDTTFGGVGTASANAGADLGTALNDLGVTGFGGVSVPNYLVLLGNDTTTSAIGVSLTPYTGNWVGGYAYLHFQLGLFSGSLADPIPGYTVAADFTPAPAPEIDATSAGSALTLLVGMITVSRARRREARA